MSSNRSKRNLKIEIIRIIACFAVIWYHIRELPWKSNGELSETAVFFESVCTICVVTFFLITGFFIYNKKSNIFIDWYNLIKKFIFQVFIPFLVICIISIVFHEFLISRETFMEAIKNFSITSICVNLYYMLRYYTVIYLPGTSAHLWYVLSYAVIIMAYPITRFILTKLPKYVGYTILIILTICMIVNDYNIFFNNPTYNIVFKYIHKPVYYSAWGHVLYNDIMKKTIDDKLSNIQNKNKVLIINKPIFFGSIIVYLISFVFLFLTQHAYYSTVNGEYVYTSWLSIYSLIMSTAFVLAIYSINLDRFIDWKIKNLIVFISNKTLYIYLIHYLVITKFLSNGFVNIFTRNRPNIFYHLAFYIFYSFFIFVLTLLIILIIEFINNYINIKVDKWRAYVKKK